MKQRARPILLAFLLAQALLGATWESAANENELSLERMLASTLEHHPKASIAESKVSRAEGELLTARGAFDLKAYAEGGVAPLGKYDKLRGAVGLRQPTPWAGLDFYAKYENGEDFAPYDGDLVTSSGGKASFGFVLPLLQGLVTDDARFELVRGRLGVALAEQERRVARADLLAAAASTWWKWVIAGAKLKAYRELVEQAEQRQRFVQEQHELGAVPLIEVVDNERSLASRRAQLSEYQLSFQRLSLKVGLYRRTDEGRPWPVSETELPEVPTAVQSVWDAADLSRDVVDAPPVLVLDRALELLDAELGLNRNKRLPRLDWEVGTTASFGRERPYSTHDSSVTEVTLGGKLSFAWEVQQRKSRGKVASLQAKRNILEQEARLVVDELTLELLGQRATLERKREIFEFSRGATEKAREVADAERTSFESGQSSVLEVNLREQAVLGAYISELDAVLASRQVWIQVQRLLGREELTDYLPGQDANSGVSP